LEARAVGKEILEYWQKQSGGPTKIDKNCEQFGGRDNYFGVFTDHYSKIMTDPFINVLFDTRHQDTNVSNVEHGKRLGGFFLDIFGGDTTYC
jgi:hypothetical protein